MAFDPPNQRDPRQGNDPAKQKDRRTGLPKAAPSRPAHQGPGRDPRDAGRKDAIPAPDTYEGLAEASQDRGSIFGRVNQAFQDVLQTSRGSKRRSPAEEAGDDPQVTADDLAIRRAKTVKPHRMVVPEGVIIQGSMSSGAETEISGRIEGDVTVDGRLYLGASALITGNVRATTCKMEGLVEGRVECSEELDLGQTARLNADALGGKRLTVAGQVFGNLSSGGLLRLTTTAKLTGNIRARRVIVEEGAVFNGECIMRPPAQQEPKP